MVMRKTGNDWLVVTGTWLDYDFPIILGIIIPTDFNSIIFQRGWYNNHQAVRTFAGWNRHFLVIFGYGKYPQVSTVSIDHQGITERGEALWWQRETEFQRVT
jgi:hypothetical protein